MLWFIKTLQTMMIFNKIALIICFIVAQLSDTATAQYVHWHNPKGLPKCNFWDRITGQTGAYQCRM